MWFLLPYQNPGFCQKAAYINDAKQRSKLAFGIHRHVWVGFVGSSGTHRET